MQITIKASGRLSTYLDQQIKDSGKVIVDEPATLESLLQLLQIPDDEPFVFIVNNEMIPQSALSTTVLKAQDKVQLIPPIRGG